MPQFQRDPFGPDLFERPEFQHLNLMLTHSACRLDFSGPDAAAQAATHIGMNSASTGDISVGEPG